MKKLGVQSGGKWIRCALAHPPKQRESVELTGSANKDEKTGSPVGRQMDTVRTRAPAETTRDYRIEARN